MSWRGPWSAALALFAFAAAGTALVAFTEQHTRARVALNERQALLRELNALVPPAWYDNDLLADRVLVADPARPSAARPSAAQAIVVYRARKQGAPVAAVFAPVAPDGYAGAIALLVAVREDGRLAGVRVTRHRETPGLGDRIEARRSGWIKAFSGLSLDRPPAEQWRVRRDGGVFDQFTGATVTPRAVVRAVRATLVYFGAHRRELFAKRSAQ